MPRHYIGDLANARHHFFLAVEHHRRCDFAGFPFADPILSTLIITEANEWLLGYPYKALHFVDEALTPSRRLMNPSIGRSLVVLAVMFMSCAAIIYERWRSATKE